MSGRIYLSPPEVTGLDRELLNRAIDTNWIAPVGPDLEAFEEELAARAGRSYGVALSSGTAGLHLALLALGVGAGDRVLVSTFTFAATANAVVYVGAEPVFIDSDEATWNMSPDLVAEELEESAKHGRLPKAAIVVDLYGQCADYGRLLPLFHEYGVAVIEDAAEALGATAYGRPAGAFGEAAVFSFNGNKIITTSGGGMLVTDNAELARRVRHLATQAREPVVHYEHVDIGFNYRMSNLLAAFGRGQLADLDRRVARKREINTIYRELLADVPGVSFMPEAWYGTSTFWLTCILIDPKVAGFSRDDVMTALEAQNIESRPTWKPMHRQPAFGHCHLRAEGASERVFSQGLCLPSGASLAPALQARVVHAVCSAQIGAPARFDAVPAS